MEKFTGVFALSACAVFLCVYVFPVHAIPCNPRLPVEGSVACLDGAPGDNSLGSGDDKAFDLNAGNYFGFNDWNFLQLQGISSEETAVDVGLNLALSNSVMGSWSIFESAWNDFENLVVILKSEVAGEDRIYWSSYLLEDGASSGRWFSGRPLSSFSIFGRDPTGIPEPGTWGMLAVGLVAMMWAGKICRKQSFPA
ncbi:PEP-CTERM sorting domain-containing protein [Kaarinaea lacus]